MPVQLSPVGPDAPCSFLVATYPSYVQDLVFYVDKNLVQQRELDGGHAYDVTTSTVVFTGSVCDSIMANPAGSVVEMLCGCMPPV